MVKTGRKKLRRIEISDIMMTTSMEDPTPEKNAAQVSTDDGENYKNSTATKRRQSQRSLTEGIEEYLDKHMTDTEMYEGY